MNKKETVRWFDKTYSCISVGYCAGVTSAFEYIISNFDNNVAQTAEQRSHWYCILLQGVFEKIQKSSLPNNSIHKIFLDLIFLSSQATNVDFLFADFTITGLLF